MTEPIRSTQRKRPWSAHAKLFGTGDLTRRTTCAVVVAHPSDEIVGAGCLISKLIDIAVLHTTDGAPADMVDAKAAGFENLIDYATARRNECRTALALVNVNTDRISDVGIMDRCASEFLAELARTIALFIQQMGATIVVTHPYEGAHPDHDATAFATHAALGLLNKNGFRPPALFEMALHPSLNSDAKIPEFLLAKDRETTVLMPDGKSKELKAKMFECFSSQQSSLSESPIGPEKFRVPTDYDFKRPPCEGKLHYENFDWAPSPVEWQQHAHEAWSNLFPASLGASHSH
jgi:LmbE family N-acetylglucosaminyl deacetylase